MKVSKRSFPKDQLAAEEDGRLLHVFTHRHKICVSVSKGTKQTAFFTFTHSQFCNLFERLKPGIEHVVD